jgi:putative spermidine/putrescine transport system permease protein
MRSLRNGVLGLFAVVFLLFLSYLVVGSMATEWRFPALFPNGYTFHRWEAVLNRTEWALALFYSFLLSAFVSLTCTSIGLLTASGLSRDPLSTLWLRLCYLPYGLSPVLYAYSMQYFYHTTGMAGTWFGVYLAQFILVYPFAVVLFFNYFDEKMHNLEDIAASLGASRWVRLKTVTLPVLRQPLQTVFAQLFLVSWFDYGITSVIGTGQVKTLTLFVYQYIGESDLYYSALASCLLIAPPLFLWLFHRTFALKPSK